MKPELSIEAFEIENFKGIKKTSIKDLPNHAPWIFVTGENGFGKTSLLQALASAMAGEERHNFDYFEEVKGKVKIQLKLHAFNQAYGVTPNASKNNPWQMFP
ncbi:MAG: AAA family ATPase, partial [Bacteroidia bacterium]